MSSDLWSRTGRDIFLGLAILAFGALVTWRAVYIPITHDEASTWLNYRHLDVWSCLTNYACWGTANNHWLNTLLLQWSAAVFGEHPWAIRLPNVLAGWGYAMVAACIARRYAPGAVSALAAWVLLCSHAYFVDFFSLARGYGLLCLGVLWGLYGLLRYIDGYAVRWLLLLLGALTLAILANFTALLPWGAMGLGWCIWLIANRGWQPLRKHLGLWLVHAMLLFAILRYPIKTLAGNGEFAWGVENIAITLRDLVTNLLMGGRYLGEHSVSLFLAMVIVGVMLVVGVALGHSRQPNRRELLLLSLVLLLNLVVIWIQQQVTGAMAPVGRKAVYLVPVAFSLFAIAQGLRAPRTLWLGIFLAGFTVWHTMHVLPPAIRYSREWWYDAFYPELLPEILPDGAASDSVRLGTTWIFNPSLRYYQEADRLPIGGLAYIRPLTIDTTMLFYYVEPSDTSGMAANGFGLKKPVGPFFLFQKMKHKTQ